MGVFRLRALALPLLLLASCAQGGGEMATPGNVAPTSEVSDLGAALAEARAAAESSPFDRDAMTTIIRRALAALGEEGGETPRLGRDRLRAALPHLLHEDRETRMRALEACRELASIRAGGMRAP